MDYQPCVGLINKDGTIIRHKLDTSIDQFLKLEEISKLVNIHQDELEDFIEELQLLGDASISFGESVRRFLVDAKVSERVQKIVLAALGGMK